MSPADSSNKIAREQKPRVVEKNTSICSTRRASSVFQYHVCNVCTQGTFFDFKGPILCKSHFTHVFTLLLICNNAIQYKLKSFGIFITLVSYFKPTAKYLVSINPLTGLDDFAELSLFFKDFQSKKKTAPVVLQ